MIYNLVYITLFLLGFYAILMEKSLIKMVIGLNIMEASVFFWVISITNKGGKMPILQPGSKTQLINDPIPQALILTGIVIGASTTAFLLTLIIELKKLGGSINMDKVKGLDE